jgi:hypothetical protein
VLSLNAKNNGIFPPPPPAAAAASCHVSIRRYSVRRCLPIPFYQTTKEYQRKEDCVQTGVRKTGGKGEGMRNSIQCKRLRCVELHRHSPICLFGAKTERNLSALCKELISVALLGLVCRRYWRGVRIVDPKHLQSTDLFCAMFTEQKHV